MILFVYLIEAEYTYKMRKSVLPVMLQRDYKMDGWLGALVGSKLYIDFTKVNFKQAYGRLMEQVKKHKLDDSGEPGEDASHYASLQLKCPSHKCCFCLLIRGCLVREWHLCLSQNARFWDFSLSQLYAESYCQEMSR